MVFPLPHLPEYVVCTFHFIKAKKLDEFRLTDKDLPFDPKPPPPYSSFPLAVNFDERL